MSTEVHGHISLVINENNQTNTAQIWSIHYIDWLIYKGSDRSFLCLFDVHGRIRGESSAYPPFILDLEEKAYILMTKYSKQSEFLTKLRALKLGRIWRNVKWVIFPLSFLWLKSLFLKVDEDSFARWSRRWGWWECIQISEVHGGWQQNIFPSSCFLAGKGKLWGDSRIGQQTVNHGCELLHYSG